MSFKQTTPQFGLVIDWETSGSSWGDDSSKNFQGLSFGAIVFKTSDFSEVESLYREIKFQPTKYQWSEEAEKIHGMSFDYLQANGVEQQEAAVDLASLILKYWGPETKVMLLGHNTEFDRRFTNQLLNSIDIEFSVENPHNNKSWIQLHHVILDTSSAGFITLGIFKSDLLFQKIGFEDRTEHNSLEDARQTLQTCQAIRELVNLAMSS